MATRPAGTLPTFLFTDIEGSTRLWEDQREEMQHALAHHDVLLRSIIEKQGGSIFKTVGDAFYAAFATPGDAMAAALQAQRALQVDPDLSIGGDRVQVRMVLHTGTAEQRDGDYFGPALNRISRLLSAAHGGQVLLSRATQELVRDFLPPGTDLRDLGEHRLKDLTRPEHVFQLLASDLPSEFPPLKTLDLHPHNLPPQPTPLIGREKEIREITERLRRDDVRLVTLTGPGGTGKTRLALQAAAELLDQFADGAFLVNLAPLSDPALVPSAVAQALSVRESPERPLSETLPEHLREKSLLLVLDNLEQLAGAAPFVGRLLSSAAGLKVLATSRIPLHLRSEHEYAVPPLSLPDPKRLPSVERLMQYEAVRLFLERAQQVRGDFSITNENALAVAEICHRLDGLPLAIELAAARIRILPPQALLPRLQNRLALLTGGARDLPARQQTLRGAIEWSYDLLTEDEKVLFQSLSVFAGGRTLEAIESVCSPEGELDVMEGVSSLVEKSLLKQEEDTADASGEPRFVMLETLHEYAREKLQESAEAEKIQSRHAEFFLALAEEAEPKFHGPEQGRWMSRLEAEHENLRTALRHLLGSGDAERAARLGGALWRFWERRGLFREGRQWLRDALAVAGSSPRTRAKALNGAGWLAFLQHDYAAAQPLFEESLSLARELEDAKGMSRALNGLANIASDQGDLTRAEALYEEIAARCRELGEQAGMASVLNNLAIVAHARQEFARAESLLQESLALAREAENQALAGLVLQNLGDTVYRQGDLHQARVHVREALRLSHEAGNVRTVVDCLSMLAQVAGSAQEGERAARLFGASEARFAEMGTHIKASHREGYDRIMAAVRALLGAAAWKKLYEEGESLSLEEAIAYALEDDEST